MGTIRAWGLLLLAAGVYLVGSRQGWWGTIAWWQLFAWLRVYWPLVLIALGLLILVRPYRRRPGVDVIYGLLNVAWGVGFTLVIAAFVLGFGGWWIWEREPAVMPGPGRVIEPLVPPRGPVEAGMHRREVRVSWPDQAGEAVARRHMESHLQLIAGGIDLGVDAGASGSPDLLGGMVEWRREPVEARGAIESTGAGSVSRISIRQGDRDRYFGSDWFGPNHELALPLRWQLHLAPEASWWLEARVGGARANFDLSDVPVAGFDLRAGAGDFRIWLPGAGVWQQQTPPDAPVDVDLQAGAAAVKVYAPPGVGVEFEIRAPLSGHNLSDRELGLEKVGSAVYRSPGYARAPLRYRIRASMGAASLDFAWLGEQKRV